MKRIQFTRILLGGAVAGLIILIGELLLNGVVLGDQFAAHREQLGLGEPSAAELIVGALITFAYGFVLIWIYAAMRPCFGSRVKTAVIAALTFWAIAYLLFLASIWANGFVSAEYAVVSILWGLIESPIAALAGARMYGEPLEPRVGAP